MFTYAILLKLPNSHLSLLKTVLLCSFFPVTKVINSLKEILSSSWSHHTTFYHFNAYLTSCDHLFPFSSPLWLTSDGSVPTRSFFMQRLHFFFSDDVSSQSMRTGGATNLALHGIPLSLIQPVGQWTSESFHVYVCKHLILIQALLHSPPPSL